MSITVRDLIRRALVEIRVARAGDEIEPEALADGLVLLNEYLDLLNAQGRSLYATQTPTFTLTPNHQPHTIGVTGADWVVSTARPVTVLKANLIIANSIRRPIAVRDEDWWLKLRAPAITSSIPTDLVFNATWPNGEIKFYPVPTTAYSVELLIEVLLAALAEGDTFDMPPGYQAAVGLTLAEIFAGPFGQTVSQDLRRRAREARAIVWGNNYVVPNIRTVDGGMPRGRRSGRGAYDYRTGFGS